VADTGRGVRKVYHAREASRWRGRNALLDRHKYFVARGGAPDYRWTGGDIEGFYTAHDAEVAFEEVAQYYRGSSLLGSDLADTGHRVLIRVAALSPFHVRSRYDGRAEGFLADRRAASCLGPRPAGHAAGRAFARPLITGVGECSRLIVPSAPFYQAGDIRWNSVFVIGPGHVPASALPSNAQLRFMTPQPA
jgi:hypothetical protein